MKRKIVGFHQDERLDWVADLECGHGQHVRHDPPWTVRPWVVTAEGREGFLGVELDCKRCDEEGRGPTTSNRDERINPPPLPFLPEPG